METIESTEMTYNKNALVIQANDLIRAKQDSLTLLENRLLKLAISQIAISDTDLRTYTCRVTDLAKFLRITPDNIYREAENLTTSLMSKVIKITDKKRKPKRSGEYNWIKFHWVSYCAYIDGVITIRLSEEIRPYVPQLYERYTKLTYENCIELPSYNSYRLFEIMESYESLSCQFDPLSKYYNPQAKPNNRFPNIQKQNNEIIYTISELKDIFNCEDKYPLTADFIKRIIEPAVKEINTHSEIRVSYRTAKEGRKIGYILFKINAWTDIQFQEFIKEQGCALYCKSYYEYFGFNNDNL